MSRYSVSHTAPGPDYGGRIDRIGRAGEILPVDVMDHLDEYGAQYAETVETLRAVVGAGPAGASLPVRIYRAVPPGVREINPGDWVALSQAYASVHSYSLMDGLVDDGSSDGELISVVVPARTLWTTADSLEEWGYHGPALTGLNQIQQLDVEQCDRQMWR